MSNRRTLVGLLCILGFAVAATYAVGGASTFTRLRARIRAFMEPPTPAQMQQATAAVQQTTIDSVNRADTAARRRAEPASLRVIFTMIGAALALTVLLLIASTRWPSTRPQARR